MFESVLIANRGEIACRIERTLRRMGVRSIAIYSEADRHARHVLEADRAICIGPAPAKESYLKAGAVLDAARISGASAIHPGYGFLSENADFAEAAEGLGIAFIGPTPAQLRAFGLKHTARDLAQKAGLPLLPGSALLRDVEHAVAEAFRVGFPVMLKSSAGGGGIGMQLAHDEAELRQAFESVKRLSQNNFGDASVYVERFVVRARHLEVQLFGDGRGQVIDLGERDCSAQRRNQKVIEETPAPALDAGVRAELCAAAVKLGRSVGYRSAGTVEFVYDADRLEFYFLEVNTRLQVEHGVTEAVTGVDLVEWMVRTAAGDPPDLAQPITASGHAIEVRLYAEDPAREFKPSAGLLTEVTFPANARVDGWVEVGSEISAFYDPLLAKLIVHGKSREQALERLREALDATRIGGVETNLAYLRQLCADPVLGAGELTTQSLKRFAFQSATVEVAAPGTFSILVDYPGRLGHWNVGIPPSGPMDSFAHRLANRIVGNPESAAALELTMSGPSLRFSVDALIALTGARMPATLDDEPVPYLRPVRVRRGQTLRLGAITGAGCRTALAVRGGFDVPAYLGSRTTFTLGGFGGHGGRALRRGDVLHLGNDGPLEASQAAPESLIPSYERRWEIGVLYGPHGAPDFFTERDIDTLFSTDWEVHYNSNRTGVRLVGPKPEWARRDGGEAGLHPSNIHDVAYAVGTIDFTGDMPILLGPDGPSLGGFVCPATVVAGELWKLGQLRPGDRVRFVALDPERAAALEVAQNELLGSLSASKAEPLLSVAPRGAVLKQSAESPERVQVVYRRAGDKYLLVEYGPLVLDLRLRLRVHALMTWLEGSRLPGIIDLTPGIRSLQIHFDSALLPAARLLDALTRAEEELPAIDDVEVPTRVVRLPLSWDDPATRLAISKYTQSVRPDAPWCPSNIEFIRRINGLDSEQAVHDIVFNASYLVLGLGDVYLGAPVATPVDPRHRLVTTKYNPARTWTPENAVGIGGAYLCIYGMEGPGGYQFVGRTLQVYNRFRTTRDFVPGTPWLLRFFDQIQFYPVSAEELLEQRAAFLHGKFAIEVTPGTFRLREYEQFLRENSASIQSFKSSQQAAFDAERQRWVESGQLGYSTQAESSVTAEGSETELPEGTHAIESHVPGSVWKVTVERGARVRRGDTLLVVESMKMEVTVEASHDGTVIELCVSEGKAVTPGQRVALMRAEP
ncbi:MAG TPA: urea carboxylase [Polyangiaceae bacterium]|nr:urea carboxylase [Polyangiaceae bacterium]